MKSCDLLLHSSLCLPISPRNDLLKQQTIAIKNGEIIEIGDTKRLKESYQPSQNLALPNHLIMPGLINSYIEPFEILNQKEDHQKQTIESNTVTSDINKKSIEKNETNLDTDMLFAKLINSGTTTFAHMQSPTADIVTKSNTLGIRSQIGVPITQDSTNDDQNESLSYVLELHDEFKHNSLINIAFGIKNPDAFSPKVAEKMATLVNEIQIPIQAVYDKEFFEGKYAAWNIKESWLTQFGRLGLLGPHFQLIQMNQLNEKELVLLGNNGAEIVHCPSAGMRQAQGYTPLQRLKEAGINVGLGLQETIVNQSLSLFNEAKIASLFANHEDSDPFGVTLDDLIHMLTLGGARALSLEDITGSIEPGKQADLIAINLENIISTSKETLMAGLIYGDITPAIEYVFVSGKALLEKEKPTEIHNAQTNH